MIVGELSVPPARDNVGFVVEPKSVVLAQHVPGGIEISTALCHFRQAVILDLVRKLAGNEGSAEPPVTPETDVLNSGTDG
jgi:hypothetical protein